MKEFFIIISTIVAIGAIVPYLGDIVKGRTKPRISTWLIWTILTSIATAAAFVAGEYRTALYSASAAIATGLVVVLGAKNGDRLFDRFDLFCLAGAVTGLVLWALFNSPEVALAAILIVDFIGALPTLRHGWTKPYDETWHTFAIGGLGGGLALAGLESFTFAALAFPLYVAAYNLLQACIIVYRRRVIVV